MSDGARRGILATLALHVLLAAGVIGWSVIMDAPRTPPERTPADEAQILDAILEEHRVETSKGRECLFGRNEVVWRLYLKARLLTLAYPNIAEGLLLERAVDSARPLQMRALSIGLLGRLYRAGRTHLDAALKEFANGPDPYLGSVAMRELAAVDSTGRFLVLYRNKCRLNSWAAFDAVSCWVDPMTIQDMNRIIADSPGNDFFESTLRLSAEEVLAKLRILASPDCDATLERIVEGLISSDRFEWALKVARMKSLPGLLEALRRRLHHVQSPLSPDASEAERHDYAQVVLAGADPARSVAAGCYIDEHFDDALVAYAELGGELKDRKSVV